MAGIKIVDLPALGRDLISTDLLEVSLNGSGSRKITGQEIMNASKLAVGSTPIVSGTVGRLLFQNTGDVLGQSANLFWDNTNGRLGIGGSPAVYNLDVKGIGIYRGGLLDLQNTTGNFTLSFYPSAGNIGIINSDILRLGRISNSTVFLQGFASGNVGINTTTDAGFKLDVNGSTRIKSDNASASGSALTVLNNSNTQLLVVRNDGSLHVGFTQDILSFYGAVNNNVIRGNQSIQYQSAGGTVSRNFHWFTNSNVFTATVEDIPHVVMGASFAPTSGVSKYTQLVLNPNINQTGGANGITRGLVIDPTLTAAADFRAIETTRGNVALCTTSGNVGIGTSTPAYVLDVVGGFRIGSSTIKLGMGESGGNSVFVGSLTNQPLKFLVNTNEYARIATTGNLLINTTTDAGFRLDVNGTARVNNVFYVTNSAYTGNIRIESIGNYQQRIGGGPGGESIVFGAFGGSNVIQINAGETYFSANVYPPSMGLGGGRALFGVQDLPVASAQIELRSTTRGFLPPRMTNAQRAAIASPAVGLIVYCTDSTEGLYVYKSTGWTFMV